MPKSQKISKREAILPRKLRRNLFLIPLSAFVIKLFIIVNIQGFPWYEASGGDLSSGLKLLLDSNYVPPNAWYGADGENYIQALYGLANEGFFSDEGKLSYWPAGYPLLMWPLLIFFKGQFFAVLAILQSALYLFGAAWLVDELRKTRVAKASYLVAIFLAFNPTLALNTISIGYELPVVALSLISLAAFLQFIYVGNSSFFSPNVLVASIAFTLATFMQPRLIILAITFFLIWALAIYRAKVAALFLVISIGLVSIAPLLMVYRNQQVHGYTAISTNLGVTMRLGAGPGTSGGYSSRPAGIVQCPSAEGDAAAQDAAMVRCVVNWYLDNPATALKLFWNKARFFWSPWFGPEANGTMARNPWTQNHPLKSTVRTESGFNLIYSGFGKFVSWLWMIVGLVLLLIGIAFLWRLGGLERSLALLAGSAFMLSLVISMLTIGDHRFRIPSMGISLLLQAIGLQTLLLRLRSDQSTTSTLVSWPAFEGAKKKLTLSFFDPCQKP